jgi:hypothetical protein
VAATTAKGDAREASGVAREEAAWEGGRKSLAQVVMVIATS